MKPRMVAVCFLGVGTIAIVSLAAFPSTAVRGDTASVNELTLAVPLTPCDKYCGTCPGNMHYTHVGSSAGGGIIHTECQPGTCSVHGCDPEFAADANEVWRSLAGAEADDPAAIVAAHPLTARLERSRRAVQLVDCNGDVFAHVPVTGVAVQSSSE